VEPDECHGLYGILRCAYGDVKARKFWAHVGHYISSRYYSLPGSPECKHRTRVKIDDRIAANFMNSFYGTRLAHYIIETIPTLGGKRTENFISLVDVYLRQFSGFYSTIPDVKITKEDLLLAEQDESEQREHELSQLDSYMTAIEADIQDG